MKWLALLALAGMAPAHTLQITGVSLEIGSAGTRVTIVTHAPLLGSSDPAAAIATRLKLQLDGKPFSAKNVSVRRDKQYDTVHWTAIDPRQAAKATFSAPIFPEHPEDTTIVLVKRDGQLVDRTALNAVHPSATVGENGFTVGQRFTQFGAAHILAGLDHILFLLGLILTGGPLLRLLGVVTAFTVAHSITLSLTALGLARLSPGFVEPMIALSIVVVGLENLLRQRQNFELRAWLAFGFGFFHGFGFAGALGEAGLPPQAMAWALAAFHAGVELGQGMILLFLLPIVTLVQRHSETTFRLTALIASAAITMAGGIWLIARIRL